MLTAATAISRFRRDLALCAVLKAALFGGVLVSLFINLVPGRRGVDGTAVLMGVGACWLLLSYRSARSSRLAAGSPSLIAAGQYDQAEQQIEQALNSFSLFRRTKVLSIHHLTVLRHAQRRFQESASLARALLGQRLGALEPLARPSRLILADALLETGDTRGAYVALAGLYNQRLSLGEAMNLLQVQLDYEARIGAWQAMVLPGAIRQRVQLTELMPARNAARSQALLALAASKVGRPDLAGWLRRRAALLVDPAELTAERPILAELWPAA